MKKKYELSRRDFLKITGLVISTFTIKACTSSEASLPAIESAQKIIVPIVPEMIKVEVGNFEMGSSDGRSDEQPVHKVEITKPFCIGKYEVSFEEYDTFCDATLKGSIAESVIFFKTYFVFPNTEGFCDLNLVNRLLI